MSKKHGTTWTPDPHTLAKHRLLREYLKAWLPIVGKAAQRVIFVDAFAGPGQYDDGTDGSPIVVLKMARDHAHQTTAELTCLFLEEDVEREAQLGRVVDALQESLPANVKTKRRRGSFVDHFRPASRFIRWQYDRAYPTFYFVDPFGFSHTPFSCVEAMLRGKRAEVFINFMYEEVNRFLSVDRHASDFDELFGSSFWRSVLGLERAEDRKRAIYNLYKAQLQKCAKYVVSFEMRNSSNSTDYFLFFATNNLLGLERMKEAMWTVDSSGSFRFSDYQHARGRQLLFATADSFPDLREALLENFTGAEVPVEEVSDWVAAETPFLRKP